MEDFNKAVEDSLNFGLYMTQAIQDGKTFGEALSKIGKSNYYSDQIPFFMDIKINDDIYDSNRGAYLKIKSIIDYNFVMVVDYYEENGEVVDIKLIPVPVKILNALMEMNFESNFRDNRVYH